MATWQPAATKQEPTVRIASLVLIVGLCHILLAATAHALTAAVERRGGAPTLLVDGKPTPPLLFWHHSHGAASALSVRVDPTWRQFAFSFVAAASDANVGLHVTNAVGKGSWWVDDAEFFEGTPDGKHGPNLVRNPGFEQGPEGLAKHWHCFLSPVAGAKATWTLDTHNPASGRTCLRASVEHGGSVSWHVHLYQSPHAIEEGKTYTFRVKLRADRTRTLSIKAVKQEPPWTLYGGRPGAAASEIALSRDAGFHIRSFPMALPWPRDGQPPDYAAVDKQMRRHLELDPKALVVPRIHTDAPQWWKARRPDHVMLYDYGRRRMASVASEPWRRDAEAALRLLVRHLEAKWGNHVLGYHVAGQSAGEWFYDWTWTKIMPNFETPFRDGFRRWLKTRYRTDAALRAAWADPKAALAAAELPTLAERTEARDGCFRDPRSQRRVIDFFEYNQVAIVEPMELFCRAVKQECGRRKLVVVFYSYLFDVAGFAYGPQVSGHLLTDRVLRCPDIDALASPISYFDRQAGGSGPFMSPVDSIQLHGKLWINEDDTRTYLSAPDAGFGRVATPLGTRWVHERNFAHLLAHQCGLWWMDLGGGWLDGKDLWDNAARLRGLWQTMAPTRRLPQPDVAVVLDERSSLYIPCGNTLTRPLINRMRHQLNRMGASVGLYLLSDLCAGRVPDARLYVFLNAFVVSPEQRQAIHRQVRRDGKWALWFYAPGILQPDGAKGDMAALTGIPLQPLGQPRPPRLRATAASVLARISQPGELTFGDAAPLATLFRVTADAPGVEVFGRYEGTQAAALALRRGDGWASVFCGATTISAGVLREIARAAGGHIWLDTGDVVIASRDLVAVHATHPGEKTLVPPPGAVLREAWTGARHTAPIPLTLQLGDTRLFLREPQATPR